MRISEKNFRCENHPDVEAIGICSICGKPVCNTCAQLLEGDMYCDDIQHPSIGENYFFFAEGESIFSLDVIEKNLHENNISTICFNPKVFGVDYNPRIFVEAQSIKKAESILESLDLMDFIRVSHVK